MIKYLKIDGYKSFKKVDFRLQNMTILTGLNGSGKSSVIQSIRMLLQSNEQIPFLEGYGDYSELHSKFSINGEPIVLELIGDNNLSTKISMDNDRVDIDKNFECIFEYIGADRFGPKSNLPIRMDKFITIGDRGEYIADFFDKFSDCLIDGVIAHPSTKSQTLTEQLSAWMREISPNINLNFILNRKHDVSHIEIDGCRAANTGFGISYALPIVLVSLVFASYQNMNIEKKYVEEWFQTLQDKRAVLLIENPEAHLHPKGQTQLGIFLSMLASYGIQVIVETHSDHFLDGARIAVKEKLLEAEKATIKYFSKNPNEASSYEDIAILNNGSLDKWPEGFFDQIQTNLIRLSRRL